MANPKNFHDYGIYKSDQLIAKNAGTMVLWRKPKRQINYAFSNHYHPYVDSLIQQLNVNGLPALLDVSFLQGLQDDLTSSYTKSADYVSSFPVDEIDVSDEGAYSIYNWELMFHTPLAIAEHMSNNQRFAEAQQWFHYIFDPTSNDKTVPAPQRFWKFLRFREETTTVFIQQMLTELQNPADTDLKKRVQQNIQAWRDKPFQPHVIARGRYLAYQMNVVMKYIDNLVAWGDNLFIQNTRETINEATQIYVLAANILGPRPQKMPPRHKTPPRTFAQLKAAGIDDFGNAMIEMENDFPFNSMPSSSNTTDENAVNAVFGIGRSLYFCIPQNDQLLAYWDTVADRLYKIRHCMNIEGIVQQLPLFSPPIDPGMLVKAAAAGIDISSIVNNINQPVSNIRSQLLLQKALEICQEVKSLGAALLSSIEKKEAEHISLTRQQNELNVLNLVQDLKFIQWKESEATTEALIASRNTVFERYRHYKLILGSSASDIDSLKTVSLARKALTEENFDEVYGEWVGQYAISLAREDYRQENSVGGLMEFAGNAVVSLVGGQLGKTLPLNKNENAELNIFLPTSDFFSTLSMGLKLASPILGLIPQIGGHATPVGVGAAVTFGGKQLSHFADVGSDISKQISAAFASSAERAAKLATYYRRAEDYVFQANLATSDLMQYGRQIISSLIREQITQKDYQNQKKQIEQSQALTDYMAGKFTQEQLYAWMQGELSKTYYNCYKFAFDVAKRTEQTMKFEVMRPEFDAVDYIKFAYWDDGYNGLLSGEAMYLDLKRLEMGYHDNNNREYEMTKHVSIRRIDPLALLKLKATGSCDISIPEWMYDMDSPGLFMRRIKTVAVSVPCIAGAYTSIHCKLSLLSSSIRISSLKGDNYARDTVNDDIRFRDFNGAIQSIVTSTAQNDSGLFETNLKDERYLPFEGAGAISNWRIELPNDIPAFDPESVTDVILHIKYTAREAGHLKSDAIDLVKTGVLEVAGNLLQLFCLNQDFGTEWQRFISAADDNSRKLNLLLEDDDFPYWAKILGVDDTITASFCCIDWNKHKLTIAPKTVDVLRMPNNGWAVSLDKNSEVFAFLKKNMANKVYMAVAYVLS
jgi:Tc toxin complex TcA C-terminal TcB-binding domain